MHHGRPQFLRGAFGDRKHETQTLALLELVQGPRARAPTRKRSQRVRSSRPSPRRVKKVSPETSSQTPSRAVAVPVAAFRVVFFSSPPRRSRSATTPSRILDAHSASASAASASVAAASRSATRASRAGSTARARRARTPPKNMFPFSGPERGAAAAMSAASTSRRNASSAKACREGSRLKNEPPSPAGETGWRRPLRDARTGRVA